MISTVRAGLLVVAMAITLGFLYSSFEQTLTAQSPVEMPAKQFDMLRNQYQDMTYEELSRRLDLDSKFLEQLPFEPTKSRYFDLIQYRLELTNSERELFSKNGFVTIDQGRELSFPGAYEQVYTLDLPVFITSDSILHAFHRSYDEILKEFESSYARTALGEILTECQSSLAKRVQDAPPELANNFRDVDLYLGVARKLLVVPPKLSVQFPSPLATSATKIRDKDFWGFNRFSSTGQDSQIDAIIANIDSFEMQTPASSGGTKIYGGKRFVDYSQFRVRGHYTETEELSAFFRCMMWLGRADCGWTICSHEQDSLSQLQSLRELRNAVLLTDLLRNSGGLSRLQQLEQTLEFLVGKSDNFGVAQLSDLLKSAGVRTVSKLSRPDVVQQLQEAIAADPRNTQSIRSQVISSNGQYKPTRPPIIFQLLGQRFAIDSFVTSRVVFDEIIYADQAIPRNETTGLDVMAALGNDEATRLLAPQLEKWKYSANLMACRDVIQNLDSRFWSGSVYHSWIDAIRCLESTSDGNAQLPSAFQTRAWQRKQLQTQLASWAELRRDNILYAKQSYGMAGCIFPTGFVEPYPQFYAKLKRLAENAGKVLGALTLSSTNPDQQAILEQNRARQIKYFEEMTRTMEMLEQIATTEIENKPLSVEQRDFLRGTFDNTKSIRVGSASVPDYSGWYCRLFYARHQNPSGWSPSTSFPVIADVHSDPNAQQVLEAATGHAKLLVIAINGAQGSNTYVGPVSTYYELWNPAEQRLTDAEWKVRLKSHVPPRPEWVSEFEAKTVPRADEGRRVTVRRRLDAYYVQTSGAGSGSFETKRVSPELVSELAKEPSLHSIDISGKMFDDKAVLTLSGLPDLRSLDLSGSRITDAVGATLKVHSHLQSLNLSETEVTDAIVPSLKTLDYLIQLDLRNTKISKEAANQLRQHFMDAEVLD
jgi:hypothetical protein